MPGRSVFEPGADGQKPARSALAFRLRRESVTVIEVALDAGYDSAEAFSRTFRRGCGMSPSRHRAVWPPPVFGCPTAGVRYYPGEERAGREG